MTNPQRFSVIGGSWALVRLGATEAVPPWAFAGDGFVSITRTKDELSVVCPESSAPGHVQAERGWGILKIHGPLPLAQVGVLASFATPLAVARISLFAISTFDTDYILVKLVDLPAACDVLEAAGHELVTERAV